MGGNVHQAVRESVIWLTTASIVTIVCFVILSFMVIKHTRWGRRFWQISGAYFDVRRSWRPFLMFALLIITSLITVRMTVLQSYWYNSFYSALQDLNVSAFWDAMKLFAMLATVSICHSLFVYYLAQAFTIRWRIWLTERLTADWVCDNAYFRQKFLEEPIDNPDQRIEIDIDAFVSTSMGLTLGAVGAVVSLVAFTGILWGLSGPIEIFGVEVPHAAVFAVYLYVFFATVIAFRLGRPLVSLNFINEKLTANFRYALMRLRANAESVAFYQGGGVERGVIMGRFSALITNVWRTVWRNLKFQGFNLTVSQLAVVFPVVLQAPRFFSGAIKLGDVMQTSQAFGQVQGSLSFFRESYDGFAQYLAVLDRLSSFLDANNMARELNQLAVFDLPMNNSSRSLKVLEIKRLYIWRPDGALLISDLNISLQRGQALLIKGPSGSGKTTLLRALAGLWPYTEGRVEGAFGQRRLFLSQRPYLPIGSLRAAIAYPVQEDHNQTELTVHLLRLVNLEYLVERLDETCDWTEILSIGEQQRLAFARIFYNKPVQVFLDESTSALDEEMECTLYSILLRHFPEIQVISVGHRKALKVFHSLQLEIDGVGGWNLCN